MCKFTIIQSRIFMSSIGKLFKTNKLGPLGLLAAVGAFVGVFLPWKITVHGLINGTLEPIGWIITVLIILYVLLLFAHFKWNILLGIVILSLATYEWWIIRGEIELDPTLRLSFGLPVIMISALVMSLSKVLLFRRKKTEDMPSHQDLQ